MKLYQQRLHGLLYLVRFVSPVMVKHKVTEQGNLGGNGLSNKDWQAQGFM